MTKSMTANSKQPLVEGLASTFLPLIPSASINQDLLPAVITCEGEEIAQYYIEFFTSLIKNQNTRRAYARAVGQFLSWCEAQNIAEWH